MNAKANADADTALIAQLKAEADNAVASLNHRATQAEDIAEASRASVQQTELQAQNMQAQKDAEIRKLQTAETIAQNKVNLSEARADSTE